MATNSIVNVTPPDIEIALDPSWDRARELLAQGRFVASALAEEIERLRAEHDKGHGGNRRSSSQVVNLKNGDGFVAQLRAQLGLHPQQAARLLENAARTHLIGKIADGDIGERVVLAIGGDGDAFDSFEVTPENKALAREAFTDLALGNVTAGRAWAGVMGGGKTIGKNRGDIDYLHNWEKCTKALNTQNFDKLRGEQKTRAVAALAKAVLGLPGVFAEEIVAQMGAARR